MYEGIEKSGKRKYDDQINCPISSEKKRQFKELAKIADVKVTTLIRYLVDKELEYFKSKISN